MINMTIVSTNLPKIEVGMAKKNTNPTPTLGYVKKRLRFNILKRKYFDSNSTQKRLHKNAISTASDIDSLTLA